MSSTATFAFVENLKTVGDVVGNIISPITLFKNVVNSTFTEAQKDVGACFDHIERVSKKGVLWANEAQTAAKETGK